MRVPLRAADRLRGFPPCDQPPELDVAGGRSLKVPFSQLEGAGVPVKGSIDHKGAGYSPGASRCLRSLGMIPLRLEGSIA